MNTRGRTLLPLALGGVLLLGSGCEERADRPVARPAAAPSASATTPSPTARDAKAELVAALQRSQRVPHRYAVQGDLPEGQRVKASGAFDPKARRFAATAEVTGGGKARESGRRIVIGTDSYLRPTGDRQWVHLDLKRVKPGGLMDFDMKDPTGLVAFTQRVTSAKLTAPGTYSGTFDVVQSGIDPYLPVGAPSVVWFGGGDADFTITTDAQGWVTSIRVVLEPTGKPKLTMTTRLSGHGKPTGITRPSKSSTAEAADFYYDKT